MGYSVFTKYTPIAILIKSSQSCLGKNIFKVPRQQHSIYIPLLDLQQRCERGDAYNLEICEHSLGSCTEQPLFAASLE